MVEKFTPTGRRWFRFSLRSFFLLIVVIAVSLGWTIYKVRQQGIAVAALKTMGCSVGYDDPQNNSPTILERLRKLLGEDEPRSVTSVIGGRSQITDAGLVHLRGLTRLGVLDLTGTPVTDAGLLHLRGLTQLVYLTLERTQVTDAGLEHFRRLTQLRVLNLTGTQVTDAGLVHLQGLTQLIVLNLDGTQVTDAGLVHLRGLTQLQQLLLANTQVTDAGMANLQGLTQLQFLILDETQVTDCQRALEEGPRWGASKAAGE